MGGDHGGASVRPLQHGATLGPDPDRPAEHRPAGGGSQADHHVGVDHGQLRLQPRVAGDEVPQLRRLVDAPLPRLAVAEVLHGVGQVDLGPVQPGLHQGVREHLSGGADEGLALPVLPVTGLLPHEHDAGGGRPLRQHGLGRVLPQLAPAAVLRCPSQPAHGGPAWHPGSGVRHLVVHVLPRSRSVVPLIVRPGTAQRDVGRHRPGRVAVRRPASRGTVSGCPPCWRCWAPA